jgi:hypothetical protein
VRAKFEPFLIEAPYERYIGVTEASDEFIPGIAHLDIRVWQRFGESFYLFVLEIPAIDDRMCDKNRYIHYYGILFAGDRT